MKAEPFQPGLDFDAADLAAEAGEALVLDLDGFEGPLHVLLALARAQKVDLLQLSATSTSPLCARPASAAFLSPPTIW